jgi:hypothetical protein
MPGLTAKVFRTYNASITLQDQLDKLTNSKLTLPSNIFTLRCFLVTYFTILSQKFRPREDALLQSCESSSSRPLQPSARRAQDPREVDGKFGKQGGLPVLHYFSITRIFMLLSLSDQGEEAGAQGGQGRAAEDARFQREGEDREKDCTGQGDAKEDEDSEDGQG